MIVHGQELANFVVLQLNERNFSLYVTQLAAAVAVDASEPATSVMSCRTWTPKRAPHPSPGRPPQQGAGPREQTTPLVPSRMCAAGRVLWRSKANRALSQLFRCGVRGLGNFKFEAACSPTQQ